MKISRLALALVAGVLFSFGYLALTDLGNYRTPRIIIGLIFGTAMAASMIRHPERFTRNLSVFVIPPLLALLVTSVALTGTGTELLTTAVCALAFLGVQIAFAFLPPEVPVEPQSTQIQETEQNGTFNDG